MRIARIAATLCSLGAAGLTFTGLAFAVAPVPSEPDAIAGQARVDGITIKSLTAEAARHEREGNPDAAAIVWRRIVELFPADGAALAQASGWLRAYHAARFERERAEAQYRRQAELAPADARPHAEWASDLLFRFGDHRAAAAAARQALAPALADNMAAAVTARAERTLALALYLQWAELLAAGKAETARPYFEQAQALLPDLKEVTHVAGQYRALEIIHLAVTDPDHWAFRAYRPPVAVR